MAVILNGEIYNYRELRHDLENADIVSAANQTPKCCRISMKSMPTRWFSI